MKGIPDYVRKALGVPLHKKDEYIKRELERVINSRPDTGKLRDHCYDKEKALQVLESFAKDYRLGIVPDKLVCYRLYIDDEDGNAGELGLTFVPVYKCWEFYARGIGKHSRPFTNFKKHLVEHGFKLKRI